MNKIISFSFINKSLKTCRDNVLLISLFIVSNAFIAYMNRGFIKNGENIIVILLFLTFLLVTYISAGTFGVCQVICVNG